jgi:hypothetical protein
MPLALEKIAALAPDQPSIDAARKLLKPGSWPRLAWDDAELVRGECQGSGATPYHAGYKCSCPSRKFPCKPINEVDLLPPVHRPVHGLPLRRKLSERHKKRAVRYDLFGDFEGFLLRTEDGLRQFST